MLFLAGRTGFVTFRRNPSNEQYTSLLTHRLTGRDCFDGKVTPVVSLDLNEDNNAPEIAGVIYDANAAIMEIEVSRCSDRSSDFFRRIECRDKLLEKNLPAIL